MYGTTARLRIKPGHEADLRRFQEDWIRERLPVVRGAISSHYLVPNEKSGEAVLFVVFADRASYEANAADPEQDRWYHRFRDHLDADPEWTDGEIIGN